MGSRRILRLPVAARATLAMLLLGVGIAVPIGAHGVAAILPPLSGPTDDGGAGAVPAASQASSGVPAAVLQAITTSGLTIESGTPWKTLQLGGLPADGSAPPTCGGAAPPANPATPGSSQLCFWCPSLDGGTSVTDSANTMSIRATCPYRVVDDADLLGSPQVAVNKDDPNAVAFFSLHGGGSTQGPTPRSRDPSPEGTQGLSGDSHTTFTSQDGGISWHDNPWGTDGYGEHITGVMDNDGNLYIGALWSKRLGGGHFDYVIKLYKEQDGRYSIATYQPSKTYANRAAGNTIDEVNLVYLPKPQPIVADNVTGNTTGNATAPADGSDVGNFTNGNSTGTGGNTPDDRVMAVWFEKALDWRNSTTHKSSWIDASWTDTSSRDNWTRLKDDQLIGPCMEASNPVAYNGKAYVACVVDAGYKARSRARVGDVDVWSIDPKTGKTHLEERTPLVGGNPRLASRADGYMALANVELKDTRVSAHVSFGWYGQHWTSAQSLGDDLHRLAGGSPLVEARITTMALGQDRNNLYFVYMERLSGNFQPPDPNPSTLNPDPKQAIEYHKIVATATQCTNNVLDAYDLNVGIARHPFASATLGDTTGVFDDLQDGMEFWKDQKSGEERIYFAYGDHGVIQYGALEGGSSATACAITAPPPFLPPPPIPAALSTASPYSMLVGATVGTTALAMVTYLLAAKRKTLHLSTAKDKRK